MSSYNSHDAEQLAAGRRTRHDHTSRAATDLTPSSEIGQGAPPTHSPLTAQGSCNMPRRAEAMHSMQKTHGNRAVQRSKAGEMVPVQRGVGDWLKKKASGAVDTISNVAEDAGELATDVYEGVREEVVETAADIEEFATDVTEGAGDMISGGYNMVEGAVDDAGDFVSEHSDTLMGVDAMGAAYIANPDQLVMDAGQLLYGTTETVGPDGKREQAPSLLERAVNYGEKSIIDTANSFASDVSDIPVLGGVADFSANMVESNAKFAGGFLRGGVDMGEGFAGMAKDPLKTAGSLYTMAENSGVPLISHSARLGHAGLDVVTGDKSLGEAYDRYLDPMAQAKQTGDFYKHMGTALIDPYVKMYNDENYEGMAGRAGFDILSMVLGGGEANAMTKTGRGVSMVDEMARGTQVVDDAARATQVLDDAARMGDEVGDAGRTMDEAADAGKTTPKEKPNFDQEYKQPTPEEIAEAERRAQEAGYGNADMPSPSSEPPTQPRPQPEPPSSQPRPYEDTFQERLPGEMEHLAKEEAAAEAARQAASNPKRPSQNVMEMDPVPPGYYPGMPQPPSWRSGPYGSLGSGPVDPLSKTLPGVTFDPFPNPVQVTPGKGSVNPYGHTVDVGTGVPRPDAPTWLDVGNGAVDPFGKTTRLPATPDGPTMPGYGGRPGNPGGPTKVDAPEPSPYGDTRPMPADPYGQTVPGTSPVSQTGPTMPGTTPVSPTAPTGQFGTSPAAHTMDIPAPTGVSPLAHTMETSIPAIYRNIVDMLF
jgi:hypothetical protein